MRSTWWSGVGATRFEADWHRTHAAAVRSVAQLLADASHTLTKQSRQQRDASGGDEIYAVLFGGAFAATLDAIRRFAVEGYSANAAYEWKHGLISREGSIGNDRNGASGSVDVLTATAFAAGAASIGLSGVDASASAGARADLLRLQADAHAQQGNSTIGANEDGSVDASVDARAGADGNVHLGADGVNASGGGEVFVGGEATAKGTVSAHVGPFTIKASGEAGAAYGAGAEAKGSLSITRHHLSIGGKLGAVFGGGGHAGGSIEIDF
jgi:hypothetical protein